MSTTSSSNESSNESSSNSSDGSNSDSDFDNSDYDNSDNNSTDSNESKILLFKQHHICTERVCSKTVSMCTVYDETVSREIEVYRFVDNPDYDNETGKCVDFDKIFETGSPMIEIARYNSLDWNDSTNNTLDPDEIVINRDNITIRFDYPLSSEFLFRYKSKGGFTRKQLIELIVNQYREIYKKEEETASLLHFNFSMKCSSCKHEEIQEDKIIPYSELDNLLTNDEICGVCLENYNWDSICKQLPCKHIFHKECIDAWLEKNSICPYCREESKTHVILCGNCKNGTIEFNYVGKVLPEKHRQGCINRHRTDGVYGIWGHDIGDLVIENIKYCNGLVTMFIGS